MNVLRFMALAIAAGCFVISGCGDGPAKKEEPAKKTEDTSDHGHSHEGDHGHSHGDDSGTPDLSDAAHGPNGGHPVKFKDADFGAEWCHYKGNNIIRPRNVLSITCPEFITTATKKVHKFRSLT